MNILLIAIASILILGCDGFSNMRGEQADYVCRNHGGLDFRSDNGIAKCKGGESFYYYDVILPEDGGDSA